MCSKADGASEYVLPFPFLVQTAALRMTILMLQTQASARKCSTETRGPIALLLCLWTSYDR